jgi:hypothetical protein
MLGWIFGEIEILIKLLNYDAETPDAFFVFWAIGWTLSGLLVIFIWLWNMKGREIVTMSDTELRRYRDYILFSRTGRYRIELISNLRLTDLDPSSLETRGGMEFWGLSGGSVTFDYGSDIQKFGLGIDDQEANRIIESIKQRFTHF